MPDRRPLALSIALLALSALVLASPARAFPVEEVELDDGLRLWLRPMPGSGRASLRVVVRAGSGDEEPGPSGVAHLLEHALFDRVDEPELAARLAELENRGAYVNAYTTVETTWASVDALAEDLEDALALTARQLELPELTEARLARHRRIVGLELSEYPDDPGFRDVLQGLYGSHPLARPEGGTPEDVERIDGARLARFHARHYAPGRTVAIVVGDGSAEELAELARRHLSSVRWPTPQASAPATRELARRPGPLELADETASGTLLHGAVAPDARDPDYPALWLLRSILEAHVYAEGRDRHPLSYGPYVYLSSGRFEGLLYLQVFADVADHDLLASLFDTELARIARGDLDAAALDAARRRVLRSLEVDLAEPAALADSLVWAAGVLEPGDPLRSPERMLAGVTPAALADAARRLSADDRRFDLRAVPPGPGTTTSEATRVLGVTSFALGLLLAVRMLRRRAEARA